MTDATTYFDVPYPYDTRTALGASVRLFGHDGFRVIGAVMDEAGAMLDPRCWYGDGYVWPPQPANFDGSIPARQTTVDDLLPPPAARAALIAAQQAIVDAVTARLEASGDVPAELLASDRAVLAAAQAQIAVLSV